MSEIFTTHPAVLALAFLGAVLVAYALIWLAWFAIEEVRELVLAWRHASARRQPVTEDSAPVLREALRITQEALLAAQAERDAIAHAVRDAWDRATHEPDETAAPADLALRLGHYGVDWRERAKVAEAAAAVDTRAAADLLTERQRQVRTEGWTHDHDDQHKDGELADAAAVYAALDDTSCELRRHGKTYDEAVWPSDWTLKRKDRRSNLVKAGALILAEIERLDRAAHRAYIKAAGEAALAACKLCNGKGSFPTPGGIGSTHCWCEAEAEERAEEAARDSHER